MVTAEELKKLSKEEKLRLMKLLWSDLTSSSDGMESPSWHKSELEETAKRFENGEEVPIDFDKAKGILRNERR